VHSNRRRYLCPIHREFRLDLANQFHLGHLSQGI
jgi:hypothetical protein